MKDSVLFSLRREKQGTMPALSGFKPFVVPGWQEIIDPRPNASGMCIIRFLPSESSIFVDSQKTPFDLYKIRSGEHKVNDIKFNDGSRACSPQQENLVAYLRTCKQHIKNANANGWAGSVFHEASSNEESVQKGNEWAAETDLRGKIKSMPLSKLKAVYRVMSEVSIQDINLTEVDVMRHNLTILSNKDKAMFDLLYSDRLLSVKYDLYEALDSGLVTRPLSDKNMFMMNDRMIKKSPEGINPIQFMAEWLDMDGRDTLETIRTRLGRNPKEEIDIATPEQDAKRLIEFMRTNERGIELFDQIGVSSREFVKEDGERIKLGNSEKSWIKTLVEDDELRAMALDRYSKLKGE